MTSLKLTCVVAIAIVALAASAADRRPQSADETTIAQLEEALGQAMIHKDVDTLARLVADDWAMQSGSGAGSKAVFMEDIKSGKLAVRSFRIHDMHVHVVGRLAWVQAYDDEQTSYDGKDSSGTYNWMDVWENRNGQWVSVATQLTRFEGGK